MEFVRRHSTRHLKKPWETDEKSLRHRLHVCLESSAFLFVLLLSIIVTMSLLVVETDYAAAGEAVPVVVRVFSILLLLFYGAEVCVRVYVEMRMYPRSFLNLVDLGVLLIDCGRLLANTGSGSSFLVLRTFRLIRVARTIQVANWLPELATMVRGLAGAFTALAWGSVLMLFMLAVWGILATQLIHPLNEELTRQGVWRDAGCERCERAFATVGNSMLTFTQQIVAGDSWGVLSVPIIEAHPWTAAFFMMVLLSVQLALVNMILAVVLDKANESRQESEKELIAYREKEHAHARAEMLKLCQVMDTDQSGCLAESEIIKGFEENEEFRTVMLAMDIEREDLELVFRLMDIDGSGSVAYTEFSEQLFKMKTCDMHTLLVFIRFYVSDLWRKLKGLTAAGAIGPVDGQPMEDPEAALLAAHDPTGIRSPLSSSEDRPGKAAEVGPVRSDYSTMASAWASEVDKAGSMLKAGEGKGQPYPELKQGNFGPTSEDMQQLREELQRALEGLSEKLEGQTRLLQLIPLERPPMPGLSPPLSQREQPLKPPAVVAPQRAGMCCRPQREQVVSVR